MINYEIWLINNPSVPFFPLFSRIAGQLSLSIMSLR